MTWVEERYCEADYSDVQKLPFEGEMSSITINLDNGFKVRGNQTDEDYRKIFNKLVKLCEPMCSEVVHYAMVGGTSFTSGSGGGNSKAHLHILLYTNDEAIREAIRDFAQSLDPDNKRAVKINLGGTNEVVDYVLQQRIEPEPLLASDLKGIRAKSVVWTIVEQYPPAKRTSHNERLNRWEKHTKEKFLEFIKAFEVEGKRTRELPTMRVTYPVKLPPFGRFGVFEGAAWDKITELLGEKVSKSGDISQEQLEAISLEITGVERAFLKWVNELSLVASYCVVSYWNDRIADRINNKVSELAGREVQLVSLMTIYTKGQPWEKKYIIMPVIDGRTTEARELKEKGWITERQD